MPCFSASTSISPVFRVVASPRERVFVASMARSQWRTGLGSSMGRATPRWGTLIDHLATIYQFPSDRSELEKPLGLNSELLITEATRHQINDISTWQSSPHVVSFLPTSPRVSPGGIYQLKIYPRFTPEIGSNQSLSRRIMSMPAVTPLSYLIARFIGWILFARSLVASRSSGKPAS